MSSFSRNQLPRRLPYSSASPLFRLIESLVITNRLRQEVGRPSDGMIPFIIEADIPIVRPSSFDFLPAYV